MTVDEGNINGGEKTGIKRAASTLNVKSPVRRSDLDPSERWKRPLTITVDGPAGSGKSTIARLLAETLGYSFIDTGATYRALAWLALERGIPLDNASRLRGLAIAQPTALIFGKDERWQVHIAGEDVTDLIREPRIDDAASKVARHDEVRSVLVAHQRQLSLARDSVLDGRDTGTNVRPDADLKLFITADLEERARRRGAQNFGNKGSVASALAERDQRDAKQSAAAADAVTLDTTNLSIEESLDKAVELWLERRRELLDNELTQGRTAREWIDNKSGLANFERTLKRTRPIWEKGFRLEAHGTERVPDEPCLFIANHASMWDPAFLIVPLNRVIRYMGKAELAHNRFVKNMGDAIGFFPVRRGAGDRLAMHIGEEVLRRGDSLGVFPEGTRIYEGKLARPRKGAARLALITGVPIVPVAIYGNRWTESLFRVSVAFGRPHRFDGQRATPQNIERATEEVWKDVQELWDALRADRRF